MALVPLAKLRTDGGTQIRASTRQGIVDRYADQELAYRARRKEDPKFGLHFPPIEAFWDESYYWLISFHRFFAFQKIGLKATEVYVHLGTLDDAILYAAKSNNDHGLQMDPDDFRSAARALLSNPKWSRMSNRAIADHIGCREKIVRDAADELSASKTQMRDREIDVQRNGTTYTMTPHRKPRLQDLPPAEQAQKINAAEAAARLKLARDTAGKHLERAIEVLAPHAEFSRAVQAVMMAQERLAAAAE